MTHRECYRPTVSLSAKKLGTLKLPLRTEGKDYNFDTRTSYPSFGNERRFDKSLSLGLLARPVKNP